MSDWSFNADFTGVTAASGMGAPSEEGIYYVTIIVTEETTTRAGDPRIRFTARVNEGTMAGRTIFDGLNVPTDPTSAKKLLPFWGAFLASLGYDLSKLGKKKLTAKAILNKKGDVYYKPAPEGAYPKVKWVSKMDYDAWEPASTSASEMSEVISGDDDMDALDNVLGLN